MICEYFLSRSVVIAILFLFLVDSVKKYFICLIIPYIFFNIFELLFETFLEHHESAYAFLQNLISNININYILSFLTVDVHASHFNWMTWYLIALFVILIIFTVLKQYLKNDKQLTISVLILVLIGYLLNI